VLSLSLPLKVNTYEELVPSFSFPILSSPFYAFFFLIYSILFLFIVADRIRLCLVIYRALGSSMFLLLFFEPFSIAFETLQVLLLKHLLETFVMVGYSQISVLRLTRWFVFAICSVGYFSSWISVA
jgi:autocrine motility factor receptor